MAFSEIHAATSFDVSGSVPRLRCRRRNWFAGPEVQRLKIGFYADKTVAMPPVVPARRSFADEDDLRALHPDGCIGSEPGLATPAHGKVLFEAAVTECAEAWRDFLREAQARLHAW